MRRKFGLIVVAVGTVLLFLHDYMDFIVNKVYVANLEKHLILMDPSLANPNIKRPIVKMLPEHEDIGNTSPTELFISTSMTTADQLLGSKTKIILMTYFRGGSSFLGEILNQNPEVFYWFEPLCGPWYDYLNQLKARESMHHTDLYVKPDGSARQNLPEEWLTIMDKIPLNIFDCNFKNMDLRVLSHFFVTNWRKSNKINTYTKCVEDYKETRNLTAFVTELPAHVYRECSKFMDIGCQLSDMVAIKTIRMPGFMLKRHLQHSSDTKVIYYTRDPRAMILSQHSMKWINLGVDGPARARRVAETYCGQMREDLHMIYELSERYQQQILKVRYEDLAEDPIKVTHRIYDFLGRKVPHTLNSWIAENTKASTSIQSNPMSTKRNSTYTVNRWRIEKVMTPEINRLIYSVCGDVMARFNYAP